MAYNYGFPVTYQPTIVYPQSQQMPTTVSQAQIPASNSGITWVQGETGAKAYPVAAGTSVLLMDSESECFYIKSTDGSGMPQPLRVFQYNEVVQDIPPIEDNHSHNFDPSKYVTQEEFKGEFEELNRKLDDLSRKSKSLTRKEKSDG